MSSNIHQIFVANPANSLVSTDLFYIGRSPFAATDDAATQWSVIQAAIPGSVTNVITDASANLVSNQNFITNRGTLVTLTLPVSSAVGSIIEIIGVGAGGWLIAQGSGQQIVVGSVSSSLGSGGSVASTHYRNTIRLMCVSANTIFQVLSGVSGAYTIV